MVGVEDRLLNRWAIQAKKLPVVPIPGDGLNK
jgi:NADH dehydrogenase (ubiquinone) 1 alpha subcomplex subunit 9